MSLLSSRWTMLAILSFARAAMYMQSQGIPPLVPLMLVDLHINYTQVGLLIGMFFLPGAFIALPGGLAARSMGDKPMLLVCEVLLAGGALALALSGSYLAALGGRLISGVGAVMLNIQVTKMTTDWFANRGLATAMSVLTASWGLGMGLAFATLGGIGAAYGWRWAIAVTAVLPALALLLTLLLYRNPPGAATAGEAPAPAARTFAWRELINRWEVGAATLAGLIRMCFMVGLAVWQSFTPDYLVGRGMAPGAAGALVSVSTWLLLVSVPLGGLLTDRLRAGAPIIVLGSLISGGVAALVPAWGGLAVVFVLLGLVSGMPIGAIMALPAEFLRPSSRNVGFAVFFTWSYVGMGVLPAAAGALRDATGAPAAPLLFSAVVIALSAVAYVGYRLLRRLALARAGSGVFGAAS